MKLFVHENSEGICMCVSVKMCHNLLCVIFVRDDVHILFSVLFVGKHGIICICGKFKVPRRNMSDNENILIRLGLLQCFVQPSKLSTRILWIHTTIDGIVVVIQWCVQDNERLGNIDVISLVFQHIVSTIFELLSWSGSSIKKVTKGSVRDVISIRLFRRRNVFGVWKMVRWTGIVIA